MMQSFFDAWELQSGRPVAASLIVAAAHPSAQGKLVLVVPPTENDMVARASPVRDQEAEAWPPRRRVRLRQVARGEA